MTENDEPRLEVRCQARLARGESCGARMTPRGYGCECRCPKCGAVYLVGRHELLFSPALRRGEMRVVVTLSAEQYARLAGLARVRRLSPEQCVVAFVDTARPGGDGRSGGR